MPAGAEAAPATTGDSGAGRLARDSGGDVTGPGSSGPNSDFEAAVSSASSAISNNSPTDERRSSSSLVNSRMVPYSPSKPACRITLPWRIREMASAKSGDPARVIWSGGACSRMNSSGPKRDTSSSYFCLTALLWGPTR